MHGRPLLVLTLSAVLPIAGCSSAVKATPFEGADSGVCRQVAAAWPATVAGQQPREVAVESETVAAWGDPAIIARCGAPLLGPTTQDCLDADGIDWIVEPLDDGARFTTYGRDPALEVLVPQAYAPEPLVLGAFAATAATVEQGSNRCS